MLFWRHKISRLALLVAALFTTGFSSEFDNIQPILEKRCSACHLAFTLYSEEDWLDTGYLWPGSPADSILYRRLRGANVGGKEDMPKDGPLGPEELKIFESWILNLPPITPPSQSAAERSKKALTILTKACASCHGKEGLKAKSPDYKGTFIPPFSLFTTDGEFVTQGLVLQGNAEESWLYDSLKGIGTIQTMPLESETLTTTDLETLRLWIEKLGEP